MQEYKICSKTVMDNISDPDFNTNEQGVCNYYLDYKNIESSRPDQLEKQTILDNYVKKVKSQGIGKEYDCLIGLSGGVDSTYVAYLIKSLGLRPLAVHLDNGWNSELAVQNINNIVKKLGIDLHTLVVDWEEFKSLQIAYLKASVVDIEVVSDHAIFATMFKLAKKHHIPHIISGTNFVTEHIMPPSWLYSKMDCANLKDINNQFGTHKLKTYPTYNFAKHVYYNGFLKLRPFSILDYVDYNKEQVKKTITEKLNWKDYGGKHFESVFTKFYQAYILPNKFGIDKRKPHLSTLICSGQISRDDALKELQKPLYENELLEKEKSYVLKKLGLMNQEFDVIMQTPRRSHSDFKSDLNLKKNYMRLLKKTKKYRKPFQS